MNILIVDDDNEVRDLFYFYLTGKFKVSVVEVNSYEKASALLSKDTEAFDAIVCDYDKFAKKLISFCLSNQMQLHFFCSCAETPTDPLVVKRKDWVHFFSNKEMIQGLESSIPKVFRDLQKEPPSTALDYCSIKPHLLLFANPLKGDILVRLSAQKYVRILKEGFEFDNEDYNYFCGKKKILNFYMRRPLVSIIAVQIQDSIYKARTEKKDANLTREQKILLEVEAKKRRIDQLKLRAKLLEEEKQKLLEAQKAKPVEQKKEVASVSPEEAKAKKELEEKKAKEEQTRREEVIRAKALALIMEKKQAALRQAQSQSLKNAAQEKEAARLREIELKKAAIAKQLEKELGSELEKVQKMGQTLGFTPEVQEVTKRHVLSTIQEVRKAPALSALLLQLRKEKEQYISAHSMLLAYVSCALATQMEWSSDTTFLKLTLAAFLHDVSLKNHRLAAIQTLTELSENMKTFTAEEIKAFKEHPMVAAEISRRFAEVPPDVDLIIAQHHERPDGSGFPRGLTHSRIGPLSTVFIVAHDLVSYLFRNDKLGEITGVDLVKFMETYSSTYQFGNFRKVLSVVPKIST